MRPLARVLIRLGRGEDGVAFVATLALFMFMYVVCMGVYAVGTQVKERIQLQNACDAAAYSAGVVQADTLSRIATINRAMAWTYVQMTRRQMDCIVARWLNRCDQIYKEDLDNAKDWNKCSVCIMCDKSHDKGIERADTCWCGINEYNIGKIWLNGLSTEYDKTPFVGKYLGVARSFLDSLSDVSVGQGSAVDITEIRDRLNKFKLYAANMTYLYRKSGDALGALSAVSGTDFLLNQIALDKLAIRLMNLAELDLVYGLDGRIDKTVEDVLRANVSDEDFSRIRFMVKHKAKPFTWFKYLHNTRRDEKYFMSFAGYDGEPYEIFNRHSDDFKQIVTDIFASGLGNTAEKKMLNGVSRVTGLYLTDGVDRWFVRGTDQNSRSGVGCRRARDSDCGIQRCYKHWNEDVIGQLIGEDGSHVHSKYASVELGSSGKFILPPTCLNFNGFDNSESSILGFGKSLREMRSASGSYGLPSIGLYSEWQWYSMTWFCYPVWFIVPYVVHQSVSPLIPVGKFKDKHLDWSSLWRIEESNQNCMYLPGNVVQCSYRTYHRGKWGRIKKRTAWSAGPKYTNFGLPGFRGYTRVYADDPSIWRDEYIGARCLPLLLNASYFGEDGKITVGLARKNDNPWAEIIWRFMSVVDKGPFAAFDPLTKWSWAFSTSTAGYCVDSAGVDYIVSWQGDHANDSNTQKSEWKKPYWNLCTANWDAVFVPVAESSSQGDGDMWVSFGNFPLDRLMTSELWKELPDWNGVTSGNEDKDWDYVENGGVPSGLAAAFRKRYGYSGESVRQLKWSTIGELLRH